MARLLSDAEREAVQAAVVAAESASGAEIVPVVVDSCGDYAVADARAALVGALLGAAAAGLAPLAGLPIPGYRLAAALAALAGAALGLLLARVGAVRRRLAGAELDERVDLEASRQFVARRVFRTIEQTGILILVARFERQVRVLADEAVYRAVAREEWEKLAAEVAREMGSGRPGEALRRAVDGAGELVRRYGPRRRSDDRNELPDAPIEDDRG